MKCHTNQNFPERLFVLFLLFHYPLATNVDLLSKMSLLWGKGVLRLFLLKKEFVDLAPPVLFAVHFQLS